MAINTKAENKEYTEQWWVKQFIDKVHKQIETAGFIIEAQQNLPYTNWLDSFENGEWVANKKLRLSYATDMLISKMEGSKKIPLVVIEAKKNDYSTHDIITYSDKAESHKMVFPFLKYGFILFNSKEEKISFDKRYYWHNKFDFGLLVQDPKTSQSQNDKAVKIIVEQAKEAEESRRILFF